MLEHLMIIPQSASKQVQTLQTMKCFNFIHPLMQKWKPKERKESRHNLMTSRCGDGTITYLFLRQRDPSTISPYASLNNCRALGEMSEFTNIRFSSAAAKSLSPICSGKPTRESTWWMLSATNKRVMSNRDFVVYLRLPSAL